MMSNHSAKLAFLALLVFTAAFAPAEEHGSFDRTLNVNGPVDLTVESSSGHIHVHAGVGGSVVVHADIHTEWGPGDGADRVRQIEQNPPIEQNGNTLRIGHAEESDFFHNISISYDVVVPAETKLTAHTGSGGIEISGLKGAVSSHAGSGGIRVSDVAGDVEARTGSGGITLEDVTGNVIAHAGSGRIHANTVSSGSSGNSRIDVETGSGGVEMERARGAMVVHAGSGHIEINGEPEGDWEIHSGSGPIELKLPSKFGFDLRARTGSGGIHVDFPITMQGAIADKHHLEGRVGSGGPAIDVETGSGGIHIGPGGSEAL